MNWQDIPLPKKMRALARDARGYPVPYIIMRDTDGKPHFTINDEERRRKCLTELRCPICGTSLDRDLWFVGGPLSAFHPHGAYNDTAMHHECMTYALRVCPYLAVGRYLKRIDAGTLDPDKIPQGMLFVDPTMMPDRPLLFVAVMSYEQRITVVGRVIPKRPYRAVEYWQNGSRLDEASGYELSQSILEKNKQ